MGERSRGGLCRPCLCAGGPSSPSFSDFLTLPMCLGMPPFFLGGLCPLLGPAARMGGPVNQVIYLPSGFLQGRRSRLFHLIHRLGVSRGLLSGPFALHQFLTKFGGYLAADVPLGPPAAFPFDLIIGVSFSWFRYGCHLLNLRLTMRFIFRGHITFPPEWWTLSGRVRCPWEWCWRRAPGSLRCAAGHGRARRW